MFRQYTQSILTGMPANRLLALDVFRGLTITAMVLVNNPGSWSHVYAPLLHANWHGWTPTDLIFPFFVFIMGVSIAIVTQRLQAQGTRFAEVFSASLIRSLKLIGLGLFLALFFYNFRAADYSWIDQRLLQIRLPGVLQRLGVVFLLTTIIVYHWRLKGQLVWMLSLLIGYWLLLVFVPYPLPDGNMTQGMLAHGNSLVAYVDAQVFGAEHVYYRQATPYPFDPEGLLSTLPAMASALSGVMCGRALLATQWTLQQKAMRLLGVGLVLIALAYVWDLSLPINKALWTSSYVLLTTGMACVLLAALLWMLDIQGWTQWSAPFVVFGVNAIAFYMFSAILARLLMMLPVADTSAGNWLYQSLFQPLFGDKPGSLAYAMCFCALCYVAMHILYQRRIFLKV
ncbi:acyltransferase family protein [Bowmanella sp. JS7-9]|uniref:Acyltransferase family protein n=1 Tax=Pseudobowmanella zhangzhouensis TaxID=1537679 RepID=A0ABW1XHC9_9ALTE|nr:DUF5009 domain-containing protein [Bowmanella sp. JS7-9]TBX21251.1 heparan-alpha-glucosaminide N-acetyltransferase [Bowmanella sp. JS7-9]